MKLLHECTLNGDYQGAERVIQSLRDYGAQKNAKQSFERQHRRLCRLEAGLQARLEAVQYQRQALEADMNQDAELGSPTSAAIDIS